MIPRVKNEKESCRQECFHVCSVYSVWMGVFPQCSYFKQVRTQHTNREWRSQSASQWTRAWFDCNQKVMRDSVDPAAGSQPNMPCVLGCSFFCVFLPKHSAVANQLPCAISVFSMPGWFFLEKLLETPTWKRLVYHFLLCSVSRPWMNSLYSYVFSAPLLSANDCCFVSLYQRYRSISLWFKADV